MIEYTVYALITVFIMALLGEIIDSGLGMMYGTLLSPILIAAGFSPSAVVPAILISQAMGGLTGTVFHHKYKNADFRLKSPHLKVVLAIVLPGLVAVLLGVLVAVNVPSWVMKSYIGILVAIMGFLCIFPLTYTFKWWKMYLVGIVSAFNKALSGGGFGPITSTGKILGGLDPKVSVATTTYAEAPICLTGFIMWYLMEGVYTTWFPLVLCAGAIVGAMIGPYVTAKINTKWLKIIVGVLAIASGIYLCFTVLQGFNETFANMAYSFIFKQLGVNYYPSVWDWISEELAKIVGGWFEV
ncbi:MAG: sulfite exporter TauE/SafE family protein [Candidatus Freyarchaeota archaeon]